MLKSCYFSFALKHVFAKYWPVNRKSKTWNEIFSVRSNVMYRRCDVDFNIRRVKIISIATNSTNCKTRHNKSCQKKRPNKTRQDKHIMRPLTIKLPTKRDKTRQTQWDHKTPRLNAYVFSWRCLYKCLKDSN